MSDPNQATFILLEAGISFDRRRILVECPLCAAIVWAYFWRLDRTEKRCPGCHQVLFLPPFPEHLLLDSGADPAAGSENDAENHPPRPLDRPDSPA